MALFSCRALSSALASAESVSASSYQQPALVGCGAVITEKVYTLKLSESDVPKLKKYYNQVFLVVTTVTSENTTTARACVVFCEQFTGTRVHSYEFPQNSKQLDSILLFSEV